MKPSMWIMIIVVVGALSFLVGYSMAPRDLGPGSGVSMGESGGYGDAGGYGEPSGEQEKESAEFGERLEYFGEK